MVHYLRKANQRTDLVRLVKPRNPLRKRSADEKEMKASSEFFKDIKRVSEMISEIEDDQKGIPILLKHYVNLGAQCLSFSVDRNFSNVVDALVVVDLVQTDPKLMERYIGKEESTRFFTYHQDKTLAKSA
jgi:hypothetical protein